MHTNLSLAARAKNLFYDTKGKDGLSQVGLGLHRPHPRAARTDICLMLNPSVNAYRRLDPHFEAPNQIKASAIDRGSMVRIPLGNEQLGAHRGALDRARRQPVPGALHAAAHRPRGAGAATRTTASAARTRFLPDNIYDAIRLFKAQQVRWRPARRATCTSKFAELKLAAAERCPKALGAHDQGVRDPVPPRGDEPVPLVALLRAAQLRSVHERPGAVTPAG